MPEIIYWGGKLVVEGSIIYAIYWYCRQIKACIGWPIYAKLSAFMCFMAIVCAIVLPLTWIGVI
jgi:hypothetical protein